MLIVLIFKALDYICGIIFELHFLNSASMALEFET